MLHNSEQAKIQPAASQRKTADAKNATKEVVDSKAVATKKVERHANAPSNKDASEGSTNILKRSMNSSASSAAKAQPSDAKKPRTSFGRGSPKSFSSRDGSRSSHSARGAFPNKLSSRSHQPLLVLATGHRRTAI